MVGGAYGLLGHHVFLGVTYRHLVLKYAVVEVPDSDFATTLYLKGVGRIVWVPTASRKPVTPLVPLVRSYIIITAVI